MDKPLKKEFWVDDNLLLRAWQEDDTEAVHEAVIRNKEHLRGFMPWMKEDYSHSSAEKFISDAIIARLNRIHLGLGIFREGELVGTIGFGRINIQSSTCEIGYWLDAKEEGKGIITRSCRKLIEYAFDELGLNRIEIRCSSENLRSLAVPERLGFTREAMLRESEIIHGRPHDFYVYGLLAKDKRF